MKLDELKFYEPKFCLNEMFGTKADINWINNKNLHRGPFELDGHHYTINIDEYTLRLSIGVINILDVGFKAGIEPYPADQTFQLTGLNKNISKIFGVMSTSITEWVKKLHPEGLMFGARYSSGAFQQRMRVYREIAKWWSRGSSFEHLYGPFKTPQAEYFLLMKQELTKEDIQTMQEYAASIPVKPE